MKTGYKIFFNLICAVVILVGIQAQAADKPNILVIMSDDVGITNLSAYSRGLVGNQTPNIDRIANEGMMFTDYYAEQSCTAGRSAFAFHLRQRESHGSPSVRVTSPRSCL